MWDRPPGLSCWRAPENRTVRVRYKIKEKAGRKVTLEENIQQLRDSLVVTSAQTLRHETRIKEHQQWLEQMELAFARMAASHEVHKREMAEMRESGRKFDERMDQIAKAD